MSKPVKEMIRKEFAAKFQGLTSLAVVGFSGLDAIATHRIRGRLRRKDINLLVVKNALAKQAFKAVGLDQAAELLDGPCAVAYGGDSVVGVVRELLEINRDSPALTVKAALLEGEVFQGDEQVKALSRFPTREEAVADLVACVLSPGASLAGCIMGPAGQVAALLKAVEEKAAAQVQAELAAAPVAAEAPPAEAPGAAPAAPEGGQAPAASVQ